MMVINLQRVTKMPVQLCTNDESSQPHKHTG